MLKRTTRIVAVASFVLGAAASLPAAAQAGRDYVYVVGSSTVFPFSTIVAERFGRNTRFKTPKVESTGSGGGLRLFCDGIGVAFPDVVNSSRRITQSELFSCNRNGVTELVEVKIGKDGIVVANAVDAPALRVSSRQLYLALARLVPTANTGELVKNPYTRWRDIGTELPDQPIEVLGPPPTSGTRDAFVQMVFARGCRQEPWIAALESEDPAEFRRICHAVREDGHYVEAGENDNLIVQKLQANRQAYGIVGFSFLDQNAEKIKGARVDGELPTFAAISTAAYPISRPLYFYVKKAHVAVIPGLREFLVEFTNERTWGDDGYLSYRGLVPLSTHERRAIAATVAELRALQLASQ